MAHMVIWNDIYHHTCVIFTVIIVFHQINMPSFNCCENYICFLSNLAYMLSLFEKHLYISFSQQFVKS